MTRVLIIDDDAMLCDMLFRHLEYMGFAPAYKLTLKDGLQEILANSYDIVILDVIMPDGNGLEVLPRIREAASTPEVIILTGDGSPDGAEMAVKFGAWDYLEKPLSPHRITLSLNRAIQYRRDLKMVQRPAMALKLDRLVGSSKQMAACYDLLAQAAGSDVSVLITGETGTGKELFAQAVHSNSRRAHCPFVVVDCAALPETLVESTLFGHEKGAFTGADRSKEGLIKQADGGTLFLDEVGELPKVLQKTFLRVLQEHRFRPVGGKKEMTSDFRLITATNRDLGQMAEDGQFRKDLLYRLRSLTIGLPPLRERPGDIRELIYHYVPKLCERYGTETKGISPAFIDELCAHVWPGNVRELVNTLEGALSAAGHETTLVPKHLPIHLRVHLARTSMYKNEAGPSVEAGRKVATPPTLLTFRDVRAAALAEVESNYFRELMELTRGSIKKACAISGLSRNRLYYYLKLHDISRFGWP